MGVQDLKVPTLIARAKSAARAGDVATARALYQNVLSRFPANRRARDGLAQLAMRGDPVQTLLTLWTDGKVEEALALAKTLDISHPTVRDIRAAAHRALGQHEIAIRIYDKALKTEPKNPNIWFNSGSARLENHHLGEAERYLAKAVSLQGDPAHVLALAQCKLDQGYHADAARLCVDLLATDGLTAQLRARASNIHGTCLLNLGQAEAAIRAYETASENDPNNPECRHNLGIAQITLGAPDAAKVTFETALRTAPARAEIHRSLAAVTQYSADHPHLARMEALVEQAKSPLTESEFRFALFKAYDDFAAYEDASTHLVQANATRRTALRYDPEKDAGLYRTLIDCTPPELTGTHSGPRPVFVVGMPRSGTTLTEQILAGAPDTVPAGELPLVGHAAARLLQDAQGSPSFTSAQLTTFRDAVRVGLAHRADSGDTIIDKMPLNFRWARFILSALPEARILWLTRPPEQTAFSIFKHCFAGSGNRFAYGLDDIAAMMRFERDICARVQQEWPHRVHRVSLEELRANPEPVIRDMLEFCDLEWSETCLSPQRNNRAVLTASAQQVRQPIQPPSTDPWTHYECHLPSLKQALKAQNLLI